MSDFIIGGGGSPVVPPPPPPPEGGKLRFDITESELVDGLRRVKFYFPLVEQFVEQIPPDDIAFLTAYLAAMVAAQDKLGAVHIRAFTPPFTEYYRALLRMAHEATGADDGKFFVIEPQEADLKGDEEGWQEIDKVQ